MGVETYYERPGIPETKKPGGMGFGTGIQLLYERGLPKAKEIASNWNQKRKARNQQYLQDYLREGATPVTEGRNIDDLGWFQKKNIIERGKTRDQTQYWKNIADVNKKFFGSIFRTVPRSLGYDFSKSGLTKDPSREGIGAFRNIIHSKFGGDELDQIKLINFEDPSKPAGTDAIKILQKHINEGMSNYLPSLVTPAAADAIAKKIATKHKDFSENQFIIAFEREVYKKYGQDVADYIGDRYRKEMISKYSMYDVAIPEGWNMLQQPSEINEKYMHSLGNIPLVEKGFDASKDMAPEEWEFGVLDPFVEAFSSYHDPKHEYSSEAAKDYYTQGVVQTPGDLLGFGIGASLLRKGAQKGLPKVLSGMISELYPATMGVGGKGITAGLRRWGGQGLAIPLLSEYYDQPQEGETDFREDWRDY